MAGCNVFLTDSGLRVYIIVTEKNQVVSVSGSFFIKKSAGVRLYEVIAVYKPDIFSMGMGKTIISLFPQVSVPISCPGTHSGIFPRYTPVK